MATSAPLNDADRQKQILQSVLQKVSLICDLHYMDYQHMCLNDAYMMEQEEQFNKLNTLWKDGDIQKVAEYADYVMRKTASEITEEEATTFVLHNLVEIDNATKPVDAATVFAGLAIMIMQTCRGDPQLVIQWNQCRKNYLNNFCLQITIE